MATHSRTPTLAALAVAVLAGCAPKPRAPALIQGETVYQNKQEGFRFVPPPNWALTARAELPPGKLEKERLLVGYQRVVGDKVARLDLSMSDEGADEDLDEIVKEEGTEQEGWKPAGAAERFEVGGQPAARAAFKGKAGGDDMLKEIVAVRRGARVYFFTGLFPAHDTKSREQVRKSVETLSW